MKPRLAPFLLLWIPLALTGLGLGAVVEFMRADEAFQREGTTRSRSTSPAGACVAAVQQAV